jgi:hypothetical protein
MKLTKPLQNQKPSKEEGSPELYVGIGAPEDLRRNVLETSKQIIGTLKGYTALKETRKKKTDAIAKFKQLMNDIGTDVLSLKRKLPALPVTAKPEIKIPVQPAHAMIKPAVKPMFTKPAPAIKPAQMAKPLPKAQPAKPEQKPMAKKNEPAPKQIPTDELERLEQELSMIDEKLSKLQ